jgi:hypothetical protein
MIRVALFADIHGKFLLPFKLVEKYQLETGKRVHAILQCGDMGAFPDLTQLDKATLRHAKEDRAELGFHDSFLSAKPEIADFLDQLDVPMICVRGNHEDHSFLDRLEGASTESRFPIDAYGKVWVCKSGIPQILEGDGSVLHFVGVGRIGNRKAKPDPIFIQPYEQVALRKLYASKIDFDLLISHDQPQWVPGDYGMPELSALLDQVHFPYVFHGHTGQPFSITPYRHGLTQIVKIAELEYLPDGLLPPNSMIIFEKSASGEVNIEMVGKGILLAGMRWA